MNEFHCSTLKHARSEIVDRLVGALWCGVVYDFFNGYFSISAANKKKMSKIYSELFAFD